MIYLDYAATTPCYPEVVDAMLPFFKDEFANASSVDHAMGANAGRAVEAARGYVASLVGAKEEDVIFTSGSTEANNIVLATSQRFVITSAVEHPSVLEPIVARSPGSYVVLPVTTNGRVTVEALSEVLQRHPTALVSIMHTNNETGTQNDVVALAAMAVEHGAIFHTDLTQGLLHADFALRDSPLHGLSLSAHKIYGPKGVGALICKPALRRELKARQLGGGHERGLRSGTLNVPGIVGLGSAAQILRSKRGAIRARVQKARSAFVRELTSNFNGSISINGLDSNNSHILSVRLHGVNNRAILRSAGPSLCFALGSACATNKNEPSHVLRAIGLDDVACNETIRVSFGAPTTEQDAVQAARVLCDAANRLLEMVA